MQEDEYGFTGSAEEQNAAARIQNKWRSRQPVGMCFFQLSFYTLLCSRFMLHSCMQACKKSRGYKLMVHYAACFKDFWSLFFRTEWTLPADCDSPKRHPVSASTVQLNLQYLTELLVPIGGLPMKEPFRGCNGDKFDTM